MEKRALDLKNKTSFEQIDSEDHRDFVTAQNNCALCGTTLELRHVFMTESSHIKEEAFCTECDMRTRAKIYTLN